MIIAGVSEVCANVITGVIFDKLGLKKTYMISYVSGVICSFVYIAFGHEHEIMIPFLLLGAFYGFSSVVMLNWVATPYLFPVIYASSTQGLCNVLARLATILAPQLAELE